ncbi:RNase adapter RapZ [Deinococcus peraridilitoris]|uniref:Putative P-loop-containing kinase n=1 Tax=Deinococcus peraridilitoris (strain DSM 19664 / LMG 22246 / CIP 109416 / KR-200) TaxID=937777 RepID=K9ZWK4_DEIPD|nr:RNase adapter RapZ [Deinococcus peraridilitoris]AFZ65966.1 putative P-loop-containing kinase [Deinococcus peraridilitoris DSM 19664]
MDFVVVSGLSGAGKHTSLNALEDAGFYAVDNLPPHLWEAMYDLALTRGLGKVAVCSDARTRDFLDALPPKWDALRTRGGVRLLFLEASNEVLLQRYNLTRRAHPLGEPSLLVDFELERRLLGALRERADNVIDTTELSAKGLAERVLGLLGLETDFELRLQSFGFKHAPPRDADLVLDVRTLPNPYYQEHLRPKSGLEADVAAHVFSEGDAFYRQVEAFIRDSATRARAAGRRSYNVAIGCTGGRHRSIAVSERLARDLRELNARVVSHRDTDKGEDH